MNFPLVSIIIPVYNQRHDFFRTCLSGAFNQTYKNIEIVISDNHSNNNCIDIIKEFNFKNIKLVKPESHLSIPDHFNFAAKHANGDYISFLSSDDVIHEHCIEKLLPPIIQDNEIAFVYCETKFIDDKSKQLKILRNNRLKTGKYGKNETAKRMYLFTEYWIIGAIIKREYFNRLNFPDKIIAGDWVLGFQLLQFGNAYYVNETLASIRFHERNAERIEQYNQQFLQHQIQRIEKHQLIIENSALLKEIGITKEFAVKQRDNEIFNNCIYLTRIYHKNKIIISDIEKIFNSYKKECKNKITVYIMNTFQNKKTLYLTYLISILRKINPF